MADVEQQSGPAKIDNKPNLWILNVQCDNIALAGATLVALAVMAYNTYSLELDDVLLILWRSVVAFIAVWLCVFLLLLAMRRHVLRQVAWESTEEEIGRDAIESPPEESASGEQEVA